eukprot:TRINITY_DN12531_c0_g1_i1.p1 TRINITY_DN12531_c0_g1~~TRINITY_DN12531_c0_g1_i1.p1  ORF type:complete len:347 (-),score=62.45 TRINITY_DN12531_c0_g1_i1:33-1073(-)
MGGCGGKSSKSGPSGSNVSKHEVAQDQTDGGSKTLPSSTVDFGGSYCHFDVTLSRVDGASIGVEIVPCGDFQLVVFVDKTGLVADWNASHEANQHVLVGDRIVMVNGVHSDSEAMMNLLKHCPSLTLAVARMRQPVAGETLAYLRRESSRSPLGFELTKHNGHATVSGISEGAVADWNASCEDCNQIRVGDVIIDVNGESGSFEEMVAVMMRDTMLVVIFKHSSQEPERSRGESEQQMKQQHEARETAQWEVKEQEQKEQEQREQKQADQEQQQQEQEHQERDWKSQQQQKDDMQSLGDSRLEGSENEFGSPAGQKKMSLTPVAGPLVERDLPPAGRWCSCGPSNC